MSDTAFRMAYAACMRADAATGNVRAVDSSVAEDDANPAARSVDTKFYRPELDALRAFAFLLVFLHHAGIVHGLNPALGGHGRAFQLVYKALLSAELSFSFGVGLFFTLSSYLISSLLLIERRKTAAVDFKAFYLRRALRIWPLYFFFVLLCPLFALPFPSMAVGKEQLAAFLLFAGNWFLVFHGFGQSTIVFLWSVCLEEQFYLVWPAVVAWRGARSLLASCIAILLISAGTLTWLGNRGAPADSAVWCNSFVQFAFFAAGGLLALVFRKRVPALGLLARAMLVLSGLALIAGAEAGTHIGSAYSVAPGALLLGYAGSGAGVVAVFLGFLGAPATWIPNWLRYLGRISYGLYVFHMPCGVFVSKAVHALLRAVHAGTGASLVAQPSIPWLSLAATVGVAHLSYKFLETPFLRLKDRFTIVRSREV